MTVVTQATASTSFEIKSANLPLVSLLLKSANLNTLSQELALRFGDIPDFFDNDPLVLDLTPLQTGSKVEVGADINFGNLIKLLRAYRLRPIAVKGGSATQTSAALAAGLIATPDAHLLASKPRLPDDDTVAANARSTAAVATPVPVGALIIDKPLRSGQQIYARGRDLVVLAMVNPGAEVIADGNIHVYAPLRGKAMAGARGNIDARIFSLELNAELLSIAGVYRTSDVPLPASVLGKPTQVRLVSSQEGDKLVIDRLT